MTKVNNVFLPLTRGGQGGVVVKINDDGSFGLNDTNDYNEIKVLPFGSAKGAIWVDSSPAAQNDEIKKCHSELGSESKKLIITPHPEGCG